MAFYDITPIRLGQGLMGSSYSTIYTAPADTRTFVKDIDIVNTTNAAVTIYVSLVSSGANAAANNSIFYNNLLPAYTTVQWCGAQILNGGGTIQVKSNVANSCTITVSGAEAV
jgi:hypothetical protein